MTSNNSHFFIGKIGNIAVKKLTENTRMPSIGEIVVKILDRLDEIEKKLDNLLASTEIKVDLTSRV